MSFAFNTTRNILYELGAARKVAGLFKGLGCKEGQKILFVTDEGLLDAKLGDSCIHSFKQEGLNVEIYSSVVADPPEQKIFEAVKFSKQHGIAGVVGFGGGSSMDVAKLVAYLSHKNCSQDLSEIYGVGKCTGERLPLIQVPTTAGTGSEVTPISIVTTGENEKKGIVSPQLLPDWAVIDGELTLTLPAHITAATGIDAMVHAIEAFTSKLKKNPMSDMFALEALRLLGSNIRTVSSGGIHPQARGEMLLGSMYAGIAFANAPVAAVHALAYPIGARFHVPHGLSNSLMLPYVNNLFSLLTLSLLPLLAQL
jgi:alcohol dehydrogenase class IV